MEEPTRPLSPEPYQNPVPPPLPDLNGSHETSAPAATIASSSEFNEADARMVAVQALREKSASSVGIMYAVMAFSVLNSALIGFGSPFVMAFGLTVTDVISSLAKKYGFVHLLWNLIPLGFYFLITTLAKKNWGWLIFLGVCYAIDGALSFLNQDWISIAVHAYVLYLFWQGLSAAFAARKLERMPTDYVG